MNRLIRVETSHDLDRIDGLNGLPPIDPEALTRHAPDAHWIALDQDGQAAARCSLWWRFTPPYLNHRLGIVGHYATTGAPGARHLLQHACAELAARGCTLAVGPMDGNTWRRYRFITSRGEEPTFFLEPDNPDDWPGQFVEAGFTTFACYFSALNSDLSREDARLITAAERFSDRGVRIRPLCLECFAEELRRIHSLLKISFRDSFLFTPLDETEFIAQYRPVLPHLRPELCRLAEKDNHLIGFIFTIPDLLQARRGQALDTVIIKTVAVSPDRAYAGLGAVLVGQSQVAARQLGYRRVIHALIHESNASRNISLRYAQPIRRYTLFAKSL